MQHLAIPMERIKAYSLEHLFIVLIITAMAIFLAWILNKYKISRIHVIPACGLILTLLEIIKELLLTYVRGGNYSWSDFPFQLCSLPMYLSLIYLPMNKFRKGIENFILTFGLLGAIMAFAIPYSSFSSYLILTIQSLAWHGILMFMSIYLIILKKDTMPSESFRQPAILYLITAVLAVIINVTFFQVSNGSCNMFFFGPGNPDIEVLNIIQEKAGTVTEIASMMVATELAGILTFALIKKILVLIKKEEINKNSDHYGNFL